MPVAPAGIGQAGDVEGLDRFVNPSDQILPLAGEIAPGIRVQDFRAAAAKGRAEDRMVGGEKRPRETGPPKPAGGLRIARGREIEERERGEKLEIGKRRVERRHEERGRVRLEKSLFAAVGESAFEAGPVPFVLERDRALATPPDEALLYAMPRDTSVVRASVCQPVDQPGITVPPRKGSARAAASTPAPLLPGAARGRAGEWPRPRRS